MPSLTHHYQDDDTACGAACAMMVLQALGQFETCQLSLMEAGRRMPRVPGLGGTWSLDADQLTALLNQRLLSPAGGVPRHRYLKLASLREAEVIQSINDSLSRGCPAVLCINPNRHWVVVYDKTDAGYHVADPWPESGEFPPPGECRHHLAYGCACLPGGDHPAGPCTHWLPASKLEQRIIEAGANITGQFGAHLFCLEGTPDGAVTHHMRAALRRVVRAVTPRPARPPVPSVPGAITLAAVRQQLRNQGLTGTGAGQWAESDDGGGSLHHIVRRGTPAEPFTLAVLPATGGRQIVVWLQEDGRLAGAACISDWHGLLPAGEALTWIRELSIAAPAPATSRVDLHDCAVTMLDGPLLPSTAARSHPGWPGYLLSITTPAGLVFEALAEVPGHLLLRPPPSPS